MKVYCAICGKETEESDARWLTSSENVCQECYDKLPKWCIAQIEDAEYNYVPNEVVDYINNEMGGDFVYFN